MKQTHVKIQCLLLFKSTYLMLGEYLFLPRLKMVPF